MILAAMPRRLATAALALLSAGLLGACGEQGIDVHEGGAIGHGAHLFAQRCSGCHTLDVVGAIGGATDVRDRERVDGPNFNVRKETVDNVLYAIRNGGFSGAIMPVNVVTGPDANAVATFVEKYSGRESGQ
jgi:mono/diheme cytochrome c family protein